MTIDIPSFTETVVLSAEEATAVRKATKDVEIALEEDIWGNRGILFVEDQERGVFHIQPLECETSAQLIRCPLASIQNAQGEEGVLHMQHCFFRASVAIPGIAEEVWLQEPVIPPLLAQCQHHGFVFTSNAHAKRPFCHVRLFHAATDNIECSTFNMSIRAADMVLGRQCSLDFEEQTDQRNGRLKLVATKLCFKPLEGFIMQQSFHGVFIQPVEDIRYGSHFNPLPTIFAAFDRCLTGEPQFAPIGSRVFFHLHGPLVEPEACDWQVEGGTMFTKWSLPRAPKLTIETPRAELMRNVRWFPWDPEEPHLVIASDPKCTRFRDDAFECNLDENLGSGFLRVHVVNMANTIPRDSPQEKWMRRVLSRHHPADADNTRTLFASWASTSAGIGFTVQEHRPALTMQLNMKLIEDGWAVAGPALFFESMVRLSVLIDSEKVTEEWVSKADDASLPETLILHPLAAEHELEKSVQQVFHDAQIVKDNRWRRLDTDGQVEVVEEESCTGEENEEKEDEESECKIPQIWHEFNYNSNSRSFTLVAEELQPSHFYAKRLLNIMNSEVFHVLDGYKELFGLADGTFLEDCKNRRDALINILSNSDLRKRRDYEDATVEELQELVWKDFGVSPGEIREAMGCGARLKRMAMMADVADGVRCHFEFTKPGRLYTQLVSQRIFLDFVRNAMKRPRRMSYSMSELRRLMETANQRQELNDKMVISKNMALLKAAWPQIMEHGGLPTKGVIADAGMIYACVIKEQVKCPSLDNVIPRALVGTKVLIKLQRVDDCYTAVLLAVYGRRPEIVETLEGQRCFFVGSGAEHLNCAIDSLRSIDDNEETKCAQEPSASQEVCNNLPAHLHDHTLVAENPNDKQLLRADAPVFHPIGLRVDEEEQSTEESSGGGDFDLQLLSH